jgi:hypothetical protein
MLAPRTTTLALLAAGTLSLNGAASAKPPGGPSGPQVRGGGCTYFWHADYQGERGEISEGADMRWIGQRWNDQISSVQCAPGCWLIAYEHADYGGASTRFAGSVSYVGDFWNDKISAMRVTCRGRG